MENQQWQHRKNRVFARGQGNLLPVYIERAENARLWDAQGKSYLDFASGIAVCNTGHGNAAVLSAAIQQLQNLAHSCLMITPYSAAVELAEQLVSLMPGEDEKKVILVTTGAEAVENAIKIARSYTGRRGVVAFQGGFHGRTNLAMALTGKVAPYKTGFGPFNADIYHIPFPMACHDVTTEHSLLALNNLFKATIAPTDVAAIIIEPLQGEGGFYPAPAKLMQALRKCCDEHGIVLIVDEIQTGFGRTGKMFAIEHHDIEPDLVTLAKGIAGGLPLAAVVGKAQIMDAPAAGGLGGTYGGSPVACAASLAVLRQMTQQQLPARAKELGQLLVNALNSLAVTYPQCVKDVRGLGAMVALELVNADDSPAVDLVKQLVAKAPDYGLILLPCGYYNNVIRFLPPLTMPFAEAVQGMQQFSQLLSDCLSARG